MEKVKILLVDDHEIVHDGIRMLLRNQPQFDIVHAVFNGEEALAYLAKHEIENVSDDAGGLDQWHRNPDQPSI